MDRRRTTMIACALLLVLALAPALAHANDSAMGGAGGAVAPIGSTTIRMAAETVQVIVYRQFAEYRVDFEFYNAGEPQRVKLGFPFRLPAEGDFQPPAAFSAWQGDTPLTVTYQQTDNKDGTLTGYYLHEADFPAGTTRIRVSYFAYHDSWASTPPKSAVPPDAYKSVNSFWGSYPYQVSSGAGWAGTIGKSVIRYYVSPDALLWGIEPAIEEQARMYGSDSAKPPESAALMRAYTKPAPGVYQWVFTDFEPAPNKFGYSGYDIALPFFIPYGDSEFALPWSPIADVQASTELKLDGYEYPAFQATDGLPSTAWAEGASGSGVGESLTVKFPVKRHVGEVLVLPGYAKTEALFRKYNRPKSLHLEFSDGTGVSLPLADTSELQRFLVSADAESVKVTIEDVYKGTTRDETYLSEIEFASEPAPKLLPFETVLAGGMTAPALEPTGQPQPDGNGEDRRPTRFPEWLRDPGWPLMAGCVGCGVLLGLIIGGVLVIAARRMRARREQIEQSQAPAPGQPPAGPPPPL